MFGAGMVGHGVCFFTVLFYAHLDECSAKNSQEARHLLSQISPFDWHPVNHPNYSFVPAPRHNDTSVWIWVFATLFNTYLPHLWSPPQRGGKGSRCTGTPPFADSHLGHTPSWLENTLLVTCLKTPQLCFDIQHIMGQGFSCCNG